MTELAAVGTVPDHRSRVATAVIMWADCRRRVRPWRSRGWLAVDRLDGGACGRLGWEARVAAVSAMDVSKRYGNRAALDAVTVEVPDRAFVAVMGPSGSGKSTLLHLLGGLDTPTSGSITFDGRRLSQLDEWERTLLRRRSVGIVFQSSNLVPVLTAEENVALPLVIDRRPAREASARARAALDLVGLGERGDARPSELSGGEQQRVAIARAIVHRPALVLADEPTGNLDSVAGASVMAAMRDYHRRARSTMVVVTHDPGVASIADEVVHLRDGRVVGRLCLGPHMQGRRESVVSWLAGAVS